MLSVNIVGEEIQIIVILRYVYRLVSACLTYPCAALYQANQLPEKNVCIVCLCESEIFL